MPQRGHDSGISVTRDRETRTLKHCNRISEVYDCLPAVTTPGLDDKTRLVLPSLSQGFQAITISLFTSSTPTPKIVTDVIDKAIQQPLTDRPS